MSENSPKQGLTVVLGAAEIVRKMTGGGAGPIPKPKRPPGKQSEGEESFTQEANGSNGKVIDYVGPLGLGMYAEGPICPICVRSKYPGILWPCEHARVKACPLCGLFVDDSKAAFFLSAVLGIPIAQEENGKWYTPLPEELMMSMARALRIGNADKKEAACEEASNDREELAGEAHQVPGR